MRFMSIVSAPPSSYGKPTPALMEAIGKLSEREIASGRMIDTGGLVPLEQGARVSVRKGEVVVQDGPFTEAKEVIGGYAVYAVKSKEEALEWTRRFLALHQEHWKGWEGEVELRQLYDMLGAPTS